jgi:hypothetical protein
MGLIVGLPWPAPIRSVAAALLSPSIEHNGKCFRMRKHEPQLPH